MRIALVAAVFWFAGMPIISLFGGAVFDSSQGVFTTRYLEEVFLTDRYVTPLLNTLELSVYVGLLATLIGGSLAWTMSRLELPRQSLLELGIMTPIFMSPFIGAIGWITLGQPGSGLINTLFSFVGLPQINVFSYWGAVIIMALYFAAYAYSMMRHTIDRLNPEMEEAASVCGANGRATIINITLPILLPAIVSAFIFTFILSAEMFSIPGVLLIPQGFSVLSYDIYSSTTQWPLNYSLSAAVGILLLILTLIGVALYAWVVRVQERFISVGAKAPRRSEQAGSSLGRTVGLVIVLSFIFLSVILPVVAIVIRSLLSYYTGRFGVTDFTLNNIYGALGDDLVRTALVNSIFVTLLSTGLLICIAFFIALSRVRDHDSLSALTSLIASIPIAVPGVLFGVGLLWLYIKTPLYATIWILILVMLAKYLPILVRMFETALMQIGRELDEAAAVCGASDWAITLKIRLPLLLGTIRSAVAVGGSQVFNELTASALLFTSSTAVLPVIVFSYTFDGDYSRAAAVALLQIFLLVIGFALISAMTDRSGTRAAAAA